MHGGVLLAPASCEASAPAGCAAGTAQGGSREGWEGGERGRLRGLESGGGAASAAVPPSPSARYPLPPPPPPPGQPPPSSTSASASSSASTATTASSLHSSPLRPSLRSSLPSVSQLGTHAPISHICQCSGARASPQAALTALAFAACSADDTPATQGPCNVHAATAAPAFAAMMSCKGSGRIPCRTDAVQRRVTSARLSRQFELAAPSRGRRAPATGDGRNRRAHHATNTHQVAAWGRGEATVRVSWRCRDPSDGDGDTVAAAPSSTREARRPRAPTGPPCDPGRPSSTGGDVSSGGGGARAGGAPRLEGAANIGTAASEVGVEPRRTLHPAAADAAARAARAGSSEKAAAAASRAAASSTSELDSTERRRPRAAN
jgi:hypothetical protein